MTQALETSTSGGGAEEVSRPSDV